MNKIQTYFCGNMFILLQVDIVNFMNGTQQWFLTKSSSPPFFFPMKQDPTKECRN